MITKEQTEYLWCEKYRPQNIDDCILPESIKNTYNQMVDSGEVQNLLLSGGAGCGKTTIAKALCNELDTDYIMINCSEDGNIDTLRTKIRSFASTVSLSGGKKIVILDEFDYSHVTSRIVSLNHYTQDAQRLTSLFRRKRNQS